MAACDNGTTLIPDLYNHLRTGPNCEVQFQNVNALTQMLINVIQILLTLSGFIAVGIIIFAGVQYMMSQGDPPKIEKAKDTLVNAIIGFVLVLLAFGITNFVSGRFI